MEKEEYIKISKIFIFSNGINAIETTLLWTRKKRNLEERKEKKKKKEIFV